jgi:hypothetical protein
MQILEVYFHYTKRKYSNKQAVAYEQREANYININNYIKCFKILYKYNEFKYRNLTVYQK